MKSISPEQTAQQVLADCLAGNPPDRLPALLLEDASARALFGILVEGLADRFEPALCDTYARLFSQAIPCADLARYRRVRVPRPVTCEPRRVFVLSRITLGADIAVTSVLMDAARKRFPKAEIIFVGPRKNFDLFAADPRLTHAPLDYRRGSIQDRLAAARELSAMVDDLVLDPDSRLTQLGLLPIGDESRYHLFESRSYGSETTLSLPELAARWCRETLGVEAAAPYIALADRPIDRPQAPYIAVSLGVGENPAKRLPDPFEAALLQLLATRAPLIVDRGAGAEESARVESAAPPGAILFEGSFAAFAQIISRASLYVGYDSAGQHAAAAAGIPLITVFAGFPAARMFHRWRPVTPNAAVLRIDRPDPAEALARVKAAL